MKRRPGLTLVELVVATALLMGVLNLLMSSLARIREAHHRMSGAMSSLEQSDRFQSDLRADLHRAWQARVRPDCLDVVNEDGSRIRYEFLDSEGTVRRSGAAPDREYVAAFERLQFENGPEGTVRAIVELRRQGPEGQFRPRMTWTLRLLGRGE